MKTQKSLIFFIFLSLRIQTTMISTNSTNKVLTLLNKYIYIINKIKNNVL